MRVEGAVVRLLILLLLMVPVPALARRALVIGADDGGVELPALRYAQSDARAVAQVLDELGGFRVVHLAGPTLDDVRAALAAEAMLGDAAEPFVVYVSAHADTSGVRLGDEIYSWEALRRDVRSVPAAVRIGVLDTCRSGVLARGARIAPPLAEAPALTGEAWLASAGATEDAMESTRLGGGTFTHHWLAALRGAAAGADAVVTLGESWSYAASRTAADTALAAEGRQRPVRKVSLAGHGDLVLTTLSQASALARVPAGHPGELAVLQGGRLLAEVTAPDTGLTLAVPPGRITLRRRTGGSVVEAILDVPAGETRTARAWHPARSDLLASRGLGAVGDDVADQARALDDVDAALHDLDARAAEHTATLDVLNAMVADPGVLRIHLRDDLGAAWIIEEAILRVDGGVTYRAEGPAGVDLDVLHVASLPPGAHSLVVELRLRPRAADWVDYLQHAAIAVTHTHTFTVRAGAHTRLDVAAGARKAPWLDWSERPRVVVSTQERLAAGS